MRRVAIVLFCMVVTSIPTGAMSAGKKEVMDFLVEGAHKQNFVGCDPAIRKIFEAAGGDDVRDDIATFDRDGINVMEMIVNWGAGKSDTVLGRATIWKTIDSCLATTNFTLTYEGKNCEAVLSQAGPFKVTARLLDVMWTKNPGGVRLLLTPNQNGCVASYYNSKKFSLSY